MVRQCFSVKIAEKGVPMTDNTQMTIEELRQARQLKYEFYQKHLSHVLTMQGDYGKWLVASLLLVHGGMFALLAQNDQLASQVLSKIYWWPVVGIVCALLCGFSAWWNFSFSSMLYAVPKAEMIYLDSQQPEFPNWLVTALKATTVVAIVAGIVSVACVFAGAAHASLVLTDPITQDSSSWTFSISTSVKRH
jgi:hypothetical protein